MTTRRRTPIRGAAHAYLSARSELGKRFGLEGTRALVAALGHPERACPSLLIAGTNGKGSVAAYVSHALRASGLRVGLYTSPHLVRVHERIVVEGRPIGVAALDRLIARIRDRAQELLDRGRISELPTYFEALTAAAFEHFRERRVDVAVLEVGLGGRLDATNVSEPLASAIVSIDFDHESFLGRTLGRIAGEKAGVARRGRTLVIGAMREEARRAIAAAARSVRARVVDATHGTTLRESALGVSVTTPRARYDGLHPLTGAHQRSNLVVALALLEAAKAAGLRFRFDPERIRVGINRTRWPGRLQAVPGRPALLLDGAHNPAGARALADYLRTLPPFVLLFGVMRDKDVAALGRTLFPLARHVVVTQPVSARAATPEEIQERVGPLARRAHREADPCRALAIARRLAGPGGLVVVAGSLYLVGEALRLGRRGRGSPVQLAPNKAAFRRRVRAGTRYR